MAATRVEVSIFGFAAISVALWQHLVVGTAAATWGAAAQRWVVELATLRRPKELAAIVALALIVEFLPELPPVFVQVMQPLNAATFSAILHLVRSFSGRPVS